VSDVAIKPIWRWGKWTPWITTVFFLALGSLIVALAHGQGEHFFHGYTICLGYFVAWGIAQSHYFKVNQDTPYVKGLLIYPLIIVLSIISYYFGNWVFKAINVPVIFGHFTFIMLGFFIFGLDDFIFNGRLSKWLKSDFLRFLFWFLVIIVIWICLFSFVLKEEEEAHFWQFFGMFQWPIVCLLVYALLIRVPGKTLSFGRQFRNFLLLFIIGLVFAYFFRILSASWHEVLNYGTVPLLPIIIQGLYFRKLSYISERIYAVGALSLWQFILFFIMMMTGVLGIMPEKIHDGPMLQWCFTVAILPLAHYWFTRFWGVKKVVAQ